MNEHYRVVRIKKEGVGWVGVVKEGDQGSVSAVSVRISQDPRNPVLIGFHGITPGIGTTALDHCDMLVGGHCHFDGRGLGEWEGFPKTERGQVRFLTKELRRAERIEEIQREMWRRSLLDLLNTRLELLQ